jgi:Leucine-rich repeat (LRR) protein
VLLDTIILSENKLTALPAALGTLQGLTVLRLANNDLRTVPHELAAVTTLQEVDCSGNAKLDMIPLQLRGKLYLHLLYRTFIQNLFKGSASCCDCDSSA